MHTMLLEHINRLVELDNEDRALVVQSFKQKKFRKKQFLLMIGEVSKHEYFITRGCVKTYYIDEKGEEHIVQFGVENWWVGDLYSFLTETPSIYNIETLEDTEVLFIDKPTLDNLYLSLPKIERYFRLLIQNAYIASTKRILETMSKQADERYAEFIKKYPDLEQRIPQYLIASYLGITPEFLSKIRRKFAGR